MAETFRGRPRGVGRMGHALGWAAGVAVAGLLAGCSTPKPAPPATVFYPALPERPRIQYLRSLTTSDDVRKPLSSFARFILGSESGRGVETVSRPYGVAYWQGKVYVCDSGGRRGAIFDLVKPEFRTFGDKAPYRLGLPINISVGPQGEKYVTDTMHGQVLILDPDDKPVRAISKPAGLKPCDAVWHDGELFVADLKSNSILVMDPASGKLLRQFGKSGSGPGEFFQPTNLAFGPDGALYVSDTLNARIQKLDREGHVLKIIGKRGMTLGDMVRPRGIAVDREGRLYVADAATDSVQVYDTEGRLLVMLGGPGSDPGCLALPAGVALSYEGIEPFAKYCALDFRIEYLILVSSQLGPNKVSVYGFGTYTGALAAAEDAPDVRRAPPPTGDKQESPKPQAPSPKEDPSPKTP